MVQCSARTVRRRALEHGLVEPGHPVRMPPEGEDPTVSQQTTGTGPVSSLTDAELDECIAAILEVSLPPPNAFFPYLACA